MNIILYTGLIISSLFVAELSGYLWHRYGTHTDILMIPEIRNTHRKHHLADLDDEAHGDFLWLLLFFSVFVVLMIIMMYVKIIPLSVGVIVILTLLIVYIWNWYVHTAYHKKNHWLNNFEWFRKDKDLHFQHHYDPKSNYGISWHIFDRIFGSFSQSSKNEPLYPENITRSLII